jgi:hypothetical protein
MPKTAKTGADHALNPANERAEKAADVAGSVARRSAEAAQHRAETGARMTSIAAHSGLQVVERATEVAGAARRETARQSAESTTELSQLLVELVNEQTQRNLEALTALSQVVEWGRVFQVQSEFMHASVVRMCRLNGRYLEIVQDVMRATASTAGDQAKKAA